METKPFLETERLLLREYTEEDAESFLRLNSDPAVMRFTSDELLTTVEEARNVLREHPMKDYQTHGFGRWACILRSNGAAIGFAGLKFLPEAGEVDLGYRFLRAWWGQGVATEASQAAVAYSFEKLGLTTITARVLPANLASIRVLEKCGLRFTATVNCHKRVVRRYALEAPPR